MEPGVIAVFVPIVGMMIPIVYILAKHQQKMAEIVHSNRMPSPEVESLRREVAEMKALLHQQVIALDSRGNPSSLTPPAAPDNPTL